MHEEMHILSHNNLEEMTWEKQKMNYKMIAVDMDGTLLDSRKQISDETVRAVRQLTEAGVLVVISTGRPVQGVEKYKKLLNLTGPVITYNGAMIVDAGTGGNAVLNRDCGRRTQERSWNPVFGTIPRCASGQGAVCMGIR